MFAGQIRSRLPKKVRLGLWVNPQIPVVVAKPELEIWLQIAHGKFWFTWQIDGKGEEREEEKN